ncbi:MAG TPA: translocation/assembly module TamB domain-containing protein [Terriglobales bacterium]|nr:translocation/assembly module TamB domain-containing protein [Terriglobales bacterium]
MSEPTKKRSWLRRLMIAGVLLLLLVAGAAWLAISYLRSPAFRIMVQQRVIDQIQALTGGRVEIGALNWNLSRLEVDASNVTIHGLEGPNEVPYAHTDRIRIRLKVLSVLRRRITLRSVDVDRPILHLIVFPDGSTNQPQPKATAAGTSQTASTPVFDISLDRVTVSNGELIVNQRRIALDFSAEDVHADMQFSTALNRYEGSVQAARVREKYGKLAPVAGSVEAQFVLSRNRLQVTSARLRTPTSLIEAEGTIEDFANPKVEVRYKGKLDLREVASATGTRELRRGTLELNGTFTTSASGFLVSGRSTASDVEYSTPSFSLTHTDAAAKYDIDAKDIKITNLVARAMGGIFTGSVDIHNWTAKATPAGGRKERLSKLPEAAGEQAGVVDLKIRDLPADRVAQALSTRTVPLSDLRLRGTGWGTLQLQWRGSPSYALARFHLEITPPPQVSPQELPITVKLVGTHNFASGQQHFDQAEVSTPGLVVASSGRLGSYSENLRVNLNATDLSQLRPFLALLGLGQSPLADLKGEGSFQGSIGGRLSAPSVSGQIKLSNFSFPVAVIRGALAGALPTTGASTTAGSAGRVHLDSLSADLQYSPTGVIVRNGVLNRSAAQAKFDLSAALTDGRLTDNSHIGGHIIVTNADLANLQRVLGYDYPITGKLSQTVAFSGTRSNPQGSGRSKLSDATVFGETIRSLSADLALANHELRITNLALAHNGAQLGGTGSYNLINQAIQFNAKGSNFSLATLRRLQSSRFTDAGLLNFTASGSGTVEHPVINGTASLRNLVFNGERTGDMDLAFKTENDALNLSLSSNLQGTELDGTGTIGIHAPHPVNAELHFSHLDIDPLLQTFLQGRLTGHSSVAGKLSIEGPLADRQALTITADIPQFSASVSGVRIQSDGPIQFSVARSRLRIDRLRLTGEDTELSASGRMNLAGEHEMNLRAEGRVNLKLLQTLYPSLRSTGLAVVNVTVGGLLAKPNLSGELHIQNAAVSSQDMPLGLSAIDGSLFFSQDRLQIQKLTAQTGGGTISIGGFTTFARNPSFNLTAQGNSVRVRYPPGVSSTLNLDLKFSGSLESSTMSGNVQLTKFGLNSQLDVAAMMSGSSAMPEVTVSNSPLSGVHFEIHVTSSSDLLVTTALGKVAGDVDLRLRGTPEHPILLGRVSATEGQITFNGQKYQLERADLTFANPIRIEPSIDMEATATVLQYNITIGLHGPVDRFTTTYRSDPPLPTADIISLLAFGRTSEESQIVGGGASALSESVSNAIIGQAFNTVVGNRIQRLFGVSNIRIAPGYSPTEINPYTQLTIEQQISDKVTVTYSSNLSQSSQQSIQGEYHVNPNLSFRGGRDQYGVFSVEIRMRKRKR